MTWDLRGFEMNVLLMMSKLSTDWSFKEVAKREWTNWVHEYYLEADAQMDRWLEIIHAGWVCSDIAINAFYAYAATGNGMCTSREDTTFSFSYCNLHIRPEEFLRSVSDFLKAYALEGHNQVRATCLFHRNDEAITEIWQADMTTKKFHKVKELPLVLP